MSEQFDGGARGQEKINQVRQGLEAERAPLTDLYTKALEGQATRDERIQLRVEIAQRMKALRGEVWDKQEVPLPSEAVDQNSLKINDLFDMMAQLENQVAVLRAKDDASQ